MGEGDFPKVDGDVLFASEMNNLHSPIQEIYTGTDFDSSSSGGDDDEQSHELTAITSGINNRNYVKVKITGVGSGLGDNNDGGTSQLKAQIKETSGSYSDIIEYKSFLSVHGQASSSNINTTVTSTYEVIYELTAGMKNNGFQIKVFSNSTSETNSSASFTNIQTVVELA